MCICGVCIYAHRSLEARGVKCPEAGGIGGNTFPNVGAENPVHTAEPSLKH